MKRAIGAALFALICLAGCETTPVHELSYSEQQEWAKKIVQRCYDQGVKPDSPQLNDCVRAESMRDASIRHRNAQRQARSRANAAASMQRASDNYYRSAASMPRTTTCTRVPSPAGHTTVRCY